MHLLNNYGHQEWSYTKNKNKVYSWYGVTIQSKYKHIPASIFSAGDNSIASQHSQTNFICTDCPWFNTAEA
jgi:hypothetical protein